MKLDAKLLYLILFTVVALARYSKQEKPEDCVVGVQYYSHRSILDREGTCAKCPRHLSNCNAQPLNDRTNCLRSCAKPKPPAKKLSTTKWPPTWASYVTSPPPKVVTLLHTHEVNENEKKPEVHGDYDGMNKIVLIVILVVFGVTLPALIVLLGMLVIRKLRKNSTSQSADRNDPENPETIPLHPMEGNQVTPQPSDEQLQQPTPQASDEQASEEQPTQASLCTTGVGGVQEGDQHTEEYNHTQYYSTLNLPEHDD